MGSSHASGRSTAGVQARRLVVAAGGCAAALTLMSGCETDTFIDPSVIGRWEHTPTVMPILTRLSSIEDEPTELVPTSRIRPEDLIPEVTEYRFSTGDQLDIRIRDFFQVGLEENFQRVVDQRGFIDIPRLPSVRADGRTASEINLAIAQAIRDERLQNDPVVTTQAVSQRTQTFSVLGAVQSPGSYFIPAPNYRLLEGITVAGGVDETLEKIYVIRQAPLTEAASGRPSATAEGEAAGGDDRPVPNVEPPASGENLIDLIDRLSKPKDSTGEAAPAPGAGSGGAGTPRPSPGVIGSSGEVLISRRTEARTASRTASTITAVRQPPPIDLPDSTRGPGAPAPSNPSTPEQPGSDWVYVDGQWVRKGVGTNGPGGSATDGAGDGTGVVTQRVIEIPLKSLLAGSAEVNIVLRPGDVVRVPARTTGLVYMSGQVVRPGPYGLPTDGRLTLLRAFDAAGGLSSIAIPERVDLTRMVGEDRQATVRLNARAIGEQTQPDIYLKPDDRINVGTNFWAFPLAVIRSGFRATYGYGFTLDRNFQGEVFGQDQALGN